MNKGINLNILCDVIQTKSLQDVFANQRMMSIRMIPITSTTNDSNDTNTYLKRYRDLSINEMFPLDTKAQSCLVLSHQKDKLNHDSLLISAFSRNLKA